MVSVTLYDMNKRTNSTKTPTTTGRLENGHMIDPFTVSEVTIKFKFQINPTPQRMPAYNYCKIDELGERYYWITWSYDSGFWYAHCSEDYLASFRTEIGQSIQYVTRTSSPVYNEYIMDQNAKTTTKVEYDTTDFNIGSADGKTYYWTHLGQTFHKSGTDYEYPNCIAVLNIDSAQYGTITAGNIRVAAMSYSNAMKLIKAISDNYGTNKVSETILKLYFCPVSRMLTPADNPSELITKLYCPNLKWTETLADHHIIDLHEKNIIAFTVTDNTWNFTLKANIPDHGIRDYWKNTSAGRLMYIVGQPFGKVQLNSDVYINQEVVKLKFRLNMYSGDAEAVYAKDDTLDVFSHDGAYCGRFNFFAQVPYVANGMAESPSDRAIQYGITGVKVITTAVAGYFTGGAAIAAAGAAGAAANAAVAQGKVDAQQVLAGSEWYANDAGEKVFGPNPNTTQGRRLSAMAANAVAGVKGSIANQKRNAATTASMGVLAVNNIAGALNEISQATRMTSEQSLACGDLLMGYDKIRLEIEDTAFVDDASDYVGKPCCKELQIAELSGHFIQCESPVLNTHSTTTGNTMYVDESMIIKTAMAQGFYYE